MRPPRSSPPRGAARWAWSAALAGAALSACAIAREQPIDGGQHPLGWVEPESPKFHGRWLRATGDHLEGCRACHGSDDRGGPVGVGCTAAGCHTRGVEWCGTCHGDADGPLPKTGAHARHKAFCSECHRVPSSLHAEGHIDGAAEVVFSGLAAANGATPAWDPANARCSGTYCHVGSSPSWSEPSGPTACDACHGNPPASHARFARVATPASCATCHPVPPDPRHINGSVELNAGISCDACHGHGPLGAPPPSLDGSTDPSSRGVGAHRRHLDETLADREGRVVPCTRCHAVPASITAPGHLDAGAAAAVVLATGESYNAATGSCVVGCHWMRDPGPAWTDASGGARACDACHGFPPATTRDGTPHTPAAPTLAACLGCHTFDPATHVDGHVDLVP